MKIGDRIYLDHQATTPVDPAVLEAMLPYFTQRFGNPHSADHAVGWDAAKAVETATQQVATLIGADADEIVFVSGATEANNLALKGLIDHPARKTRNRILVLCIDHKSVLASARDLRDRHGFTLQEIPVTSTGMIDMDAFESMLGDDVLVASIGLVNGEIGSIQPLEQIAALTRKHGILLHTDAAQAPVAMDLKHTSQLVDLLSLSAHKMYGPQGIGALFVERSLQRHMRPLISGGGQQNNLRSGTVPLPLCIGMGAASDLWATPSADHIRDEIRHTRDTFVDALRTANIQIELNGPSLLDRHPGNASIRLINHSADVVLTHLQPTLSASTGAACSSSMPEQSHVLTQLGLSAADARETIRFSFGRYTSTDHLEIAVTDLQAALNRNTKLLLLTPPNPTTMPIEPTRNQPITSLARR